MPGFRSRLFAALLLVVAAAACGFGGRRQYEYEEQLYLFADGSAAVMVNASIPALVALRGLPLDPNARTRVDRGELRALVAEPSIEITRVSRPWRRNGRQFIQIRAEVDDVRKLSETKLFRWSRYSVENREAAEDTEAARVYKQLVGAPSGVLPGNAGWDGSELVAFKLHLPSRIISDNTGGVERGNILTWEQRLSDRLQGQPVDIQVTMESGSILYRTLSVFAVSFAAAMALLVLIVWAVVRRGRKKIAASPPGA